MAHRPDRPSSGQTLVLFALSLVVMLLVVGLVVDGGFALSQRRIAQNAADFAAIAGTRIVSEALLGDTANGNDANARGAIDSVVAANHAQPVTYGAPNGPSYVGRTGSVVGYVGSGSIPAGAEGVVVRAQTTWSPFFLGVIGIKDWTAGATATAVSPGQNLAGGVVPFTMSEATVLGPGAYPVCPKGKNPGDPGCAVQNFSCDAGGGKCNGHLTAPGGFDWLKFGCYPDTVSGKLYGLGQVPSASNGGCQNNTPFMIGTPPSPGGQWGALPGIPPQTYGCCTSISGSTAAGYGNYIGSYTGNVSAIDDTAAGVSYYETTGVYAFVPVYDSWGGTGSNAWYHIVGYTSVQLVHVNGGKTITGVIRGSGGLLDVPYDPALTTYKGAVQLIR